MLTEAAARPSIDDAIRRLRETFPFPGYTEEGELGGSYRTIAEAAIRYLPAGGRVLDFGSGPADKAAVLAHLGFDCTEVDDLNDHWHREGDARERILSFASEAGVDFHTELESALAPDAYDAIIALDVFEHLHSSPRELLDLLLPSLRAGGHLIVTVPNAVDGIKRLRVLLGRTNYPNYGLFYWYPGPWRGHVREYTAGDLRSMAAFQGLELRELAHVHHYAFKVPAALRIPHRIACAVAPSLRDTLLLIARKPAGWEPRPAQDLSR